MIRDEIVAVFGADTKKVDAVLRGMRNKMAAFGKDMVSALNPMTLLSGFAAGFALTSVVDKVGQFVNSIRQLTEEVIRNAEMSGTTTTYIQQMGFAAGQSNVKVEDLTTGLSKLSKLMGEARSGNEEAQKSFYKWGISLEDSRGRALGVDEVMDLIADKMASIEDPALRSAMAIELMSKSGAKLIPVLKDGADALRKMREAAPVITPEQLAAIDKLDDSWGAFKQNVLADGAQVIGVIGQVAAKLGELVGLTAGQSQSSLFKFISNRLLFELPTGAKAIQQMIDLLNTKDADGKALPLPNKNQVTVNVTAEQLEKLNKVFEMEKKRAEQAERRAKAERDAQFYSITEAGNKLTGARGRFQHDQRERYGLTLEQLGGENALTWRGDPNARAKNMARDILDIREYAQASLDNYGNVDFYQSEMKRADALTKQLGAMGLLKPSEFESIDASLKELVVKWAEYMTLVTTGGINTNPANGQ